MYVHVRAEHQKRWAKNSGNKAKFLVMVEIGKFKHHRHNENKYGALNARRKECVYHESKQRIMTTIEKYIVYIIIAYPEKKRRWFYGEHFAFANKQAVKTVILRSKRMNYSSVGISGKLANTVMLRIWILDIGYGHWNSKNSLEILSFKAVSIHLEQLILIVNEFLPKPWLMNIEIVPGFSFNQNECVEFINIWLLHPAQKTAKITKSQLFFLVCMRVWCFFLNRSPSSSSSHPWWKSFVPT